MHKKTKVLLVLAAFVSAPMAFASSAFADDEGGHGMRMHEMGGPGHDMGMGDEHGPMTRAEFEAKSSANFKDADVHHKGAITFDEFNAFVEKQMEKHRQEMMKRHFDKMDTNHDGKVSEEEFKAAQAKMFEMMDANKDGKLSAEDRQERRENMHERVRDKLHMGKDDKDK